MWNLSCSLLKLNILILYLHHGQNILVTAGLTYEFVTADTPDPYVRLNTDAISTAQCGAECLNQSEDCKAFVFNPSADAKCCLYKSISLNELSNAVYAVPKPTMKTQKLDLGHQIQVRANTSFGVVSIDKADSSVRVISQAKSAAQCGLECTIGTEECKGYNYIASASHSCYLYQSIPLTDKEGAEIFAVSTPESATQKMQLTIDTGTEAVLSTEHDGHAYRAVDGVYDYDAGSAHTKYEVSPWIQISLVQDETIRGVKIWNRCGPNLEYCDRLNNVLISVSVDDAEEGFGVRGTKSACSYSPGNQPAVKMHLCYEGMIGRYVRLTMVEGNNYLDILELEVHV